VSGPSKIISKEYGAHSLRPCKGIPIYIVSDFVYTLPCALPHTAIFSVAHGRVHCRTQPHALPHIAALPHTAALAYTHCHTATHCRKLPHTAVHCRTLPHTAAHCPSKQSLGGPDPPRSTSNNPRNTQAVQGTAVHPTCTNNIYAEAKYIDRNNL
jgi:hypothetical protein